MDFTTVFAQYKMSRDTLHALGEEEQQALERAAQGADWTTDAGGGLLSPPQNLQMPLVSPGGSAAVERQRVPFPWADKATLASAQGLAQAQLLIFDVYSVAPLGGEMRLVHSSHFFDLQGDPIVAYQPVPFKLTQQVTLAERAEIGFSPQSRTTVLGYRVLLTGEEVRTINSRLVFLPRRNVVGKVKWLAVYDHVLEAQGGEITHVCQARAVLDIEGHGKRNLHASTLGSTHFSGPTLHALSALGTQPYGIVEGEYPSPPVPASRRLLDELLRPPVPAPPKAPKPVKAPKAKKATKVPPAAAPVAPDPAEVPEVAEASGTLPSPTVEPSAAPSPAPAPAPITAPAAPAPSPAPAEPAAHDPLAWETLSERIAIDEDVLAQARAAIARQRPLLLTGAPGTGKTLLATLLAEAICGPNNYTLVTADARWTSSEVLGGLRVMPGDGLRYHFSPGVVTRAAMRHRQSVQATGRPHALIIDEFNRAHQDEAFGRLLTLLDQAYRQQMPLVSAQDGAETEVYLPDDFPLIATMNNADLGRLHEIGSALQRRFVSVEVGVPAGERAFLERKWKGLPAQTLDTLYDFVGSGDPVADQEAGRLRGYVAVGTFFMEEVLSLADSLGLDKALRNQLAPHLGNLGRAELTRLLDTARATGLERVAKQLDAAARLAPF